MSIEIAGLYSVSGLFKALVLAEEVEEQPKSGVSNVGEVDDVALVVKDVLVLVVLTLRSGIETTSLLDRVGKESEAVVFIDEGFGAVVSAFGTPVIALSS